MCVSRVAQHKFLNIVKRFVAGLSEIKLQMPQVCAQSLEKSYMKP